MEKHKAVFQMKQGIWYTIPGYNGYEFNSDNQVRSFKNFKKYPYGYLKKPKINKKGELYWELSNNSNVVHKVTVSEIVQRILDRGELNCERQWNYTDIDSRNRIIEDPRERELARFGTKKEDLKKTSYAKFTII